MARKCGSQASMCAITARVASSGEACPDAYSASSSAALAWCSSAIAALHCHDSAARSLAKIGELAHMPLSPRLPTATCAGLKM